MHEVWGRRDAVRVGLAVAGGTAASSEEERRLLDSFHQLSYGPEVERESRRRAPRSPGAAWPFSRRPGQTHPSVAFRCPRQTKRLRGKIQGQAKT